MNAPAKTRRAGAEAAPALSRDMEALLAANVAALTIYDMLKPHTEQENLLLTDCKLLQKTGGKSHFKRKLKRRCSAMVIVLSDTVAQGKKEDTAGRSICEVLTTAGFDPIGYCVLPDESAERGTIEPRSLECKRACVTDDRLPFSVGRAMLQFVRDAKKMPR